MKVSQKSAEKSLLRSPPHDDIAGEHLRDHRQTPRPQARAAFVEGLVERARYVNERQRLADLMRGEYTPEVRAERLRINAEFPIHEG